MPLPTEAVKKKKSFFKGGVEMSAVRKAELKVYGFPEHEGYVPSIRVTGKWLVEVGFGLGDKVNLSAKNGKIVIERRKS
jgi:hypothetical protein